jgi:hypothetical protein
MGKRDEGRKPRVYREVIDELVRECKKGQGQVGARRVRKGVWNANARADFLPEQHAINVWLGRMSVEEREILAGMLTHAVEVGVFEALKVLERWKIEPFREGYEGSPYEDFIGRMADWEWPEG